LIVLLRFFLIVSIIVILNLLNFDRVVSSGLQTAMTQEDFVSFRFLSAIGYVILIDFLYALFYQFSTLTGRRIFGKLLLGKFRKPQTEQRVFMFIDLKDSTTHAEHLGHIKFAELIQECFKIFGMIALNRDVEIYQYVGDEVIVSWYTKNAARRNNSLHLFFEFKEKLHYHGDRFMQKFGVEPVFKAGIHMGEVTVAEIGVAKRGIEYLSDVLNTAARIQGECNHHQTDLLISGELKSTLAHEEEFDIEFLGNVQLKGKTKKVDLFKVSKKEEPALN
jgi:adenylate cyclase